jgi:DNA anti-recombination protein RmuC
MEITQQEIKKSRKRKNLQFDKKSKDSQYVVFMFMPGEGAKYRFAIPRILQNLGGVAQWFVRMSS